MTKTALEVSLGLSLKTYHLLNWATFRGDHDAQSCICDEAENVIGLIIKNTDLLKITLPDLPHLEYCCISDNKKLEELVFDKALANVTYLDLSDNELREICFSAGFEELNRLDLSRNKLKIIPFDGIYPKLNMLDLSGNSIKNWNVWELEKFPVLEYLYFSKELLNESLTTYHQGGANFLAGFKELNEAFGKGERVLNKEYKLLVVGDGKAGKTKFVDRLIHDRFIEQKGEDWDSTHAISVKQFTNEKGLYNFKYILNVWDFGGQDIYHTTHRLFMQSNSTYILIWNRETEIEKDSIVRVEGGEKREWKNRRWKYWLRYIAYLGGKSPVVIAQSHSPKKNPRLPHPDKQLIQKGYDNYFSELVFSHMDSKPNLLEDNNYEQLVQSLNTAINGLQRFEYLPAHWVTIREKLEAHRKKNKEQNKVGNHLMPYEEYYDLAETEGEKRPEKLLNWLVKTGVVYYKEGLFDNQIILNQEWAIKAIYTLFDRDEGYFNEISKANGRFSGKDLQRYWKEYSLKEQQLFLSFMISCEMCFEILEPHQAHKKYEEKPFEERQFMAVEMLPENRPTGFDDLEGDWKRGEVELVYLQYRHSFLHFGIIQSFIARTSHFANVRQVYKNGILLRIEGKPVLIEATTNETEHSGAITVKLSKQNIAILHRIQKEFSHIHDRKDILELVSLDGKVFVDLKKLRDKQNEEQMVAACESIVNVIDYQCFLQKKEGVESLSEEVERVDKKHRGIVLRNYPKETATIIEIEGTAPKFIPFKKSKKKVKILFLSAAPSNTGQINTGKDSRFQDLFKYFDDQKKFKWKEQHGVNVDQFTNFLIKEKPHILHYGGHGEVEGIVLEEGTLAGDILRDILRISKKTQCVVLSACYSITIAKLVAEYVPYVIGTQGTIDDRTAIAFAKGFYMGIVADDTIEDAFEYGLLKIRQKKLPDVDKFILVKGVQKKKV